MTKDQAQILMKITDIDSAIFKKVKEITEQSQFTEVDRLYLHHLISIREKLEVLFQVQGLLSEADETL